ALALGALAFLSVACNHEKQGKSGLLQGRSIAKVRGDIGQECSAARPWLVLCVAEHRASRNAFFSPQRIVGQARCVTAQGLSAPVARSLPLWKKHRSAVRCAPLLAIHVAATWRSRGMPPSKRREPNPRLANARMTQAPIVASDPPWSRRVRARIAQHRSRP